MKKSEAEEKRGVETIHEKDIETGGGLDRVLDHEFLYDAGNGAADHESGYRAPGGGFITFEIVDHHDGRDGEEVEQVDTDGQAHHIKDEDDPFVGAGFIGIMFPF